MKRLIENFKRSLHIYNHRTLTSENVEKGVTVLRNMVMVSGQHWSFEYNTYRRASSNDIYYHHGQINASFGNRDEVKLTMS